MPRQQRKLSRTSIYHVMLRGNERKKIFKSNQEKQRFLENVSIKQKELWFSVYAYCIMDNHVHLVINSQDKDISTIMKGIAIRYASFFNAQHNRVGHVFQDRFKSESVEDERYLMAVIRYIHNNPVKAKMVDKPEDYGWSSYSLFLRKPGSVTGGIDVDTQYILGIIAEGWQEAIKEFIRFSTEEDTSSYLDWDDEDSIQTIEQGRGYLEDYLMTYYQGVAWEQLRQDAMIKKKVIQYLRSTTKLSIRTIAELLGVDRNIVQRNRP